MKTTVNSSDFIDAFRGREGRYDQMGGYPGLHALFRHLEEWERDTGQEIELDVIGLCCDWSHYDNVADAYAELISGDAEDEDAMVLEFMLAGATVIQYAGGCFVSQF
jgi:hypothetical protein